MKRLCTAFLLFVFLVFWLVLDAREAPLITWLATLFNQGPPQ